jgi:lipoprotein-releasing system permease protein
MFFNFSIYFIALRYLKPSKEQGMVSIISLFSFLGIMLGVGTLIIVMSVMNGFRIELLDKIIGLNGHLSIYTSQKSDVLNNFEKKVTENPQVRTIRKVVDGQALIISNNLSTGILLKGINEKEFTKFKQLKKNFTLSENLRFSENHIVLGEKLFNRINLNIGDKIKLIIPKSSNTPFGNIPKTKTLYIGGYFNTGMFTYDNNLAFLDFDMAKKLFLSNKNKIYFEVELNDIDKVDVFKKEIFESKSINIQIYDWRFSNETFFNAIKTERNVMFLILTLIILVAAFNIISSLIMLVKNKQIDIAILRTMGASNKTIAKIFFLNGAIIGILGTFFGSLFGIIFANNINKLKEWLEGFTNTELFSAEIYFLSHLPAKVEFVEVFYVIITSLIICFLASFYPAWRASKMNPIDLIRKE